MIELGVCRLLQRGLARIKQYGVLKSDGDSPRRRIEFNVHTRSEPCSIGRTLVHFINLSLQLVDCLLARHNRIGQFALTQFLGLVPALQVPVFHQ